MQDVNTNQKNIGQISKHNPGWKGKGIPNVKTLTYKLFQNFKTNLLNGNFRLFINNLKASVVNISKFTIKRNQKNVVCPCCKWEGSGFITTCNSKRVNYNSNCPNCDSRSRHRGLSILLVKVLNNTTSSLLFFAPEKILKNIIQKDLENIQIKTTDFYSTDVDFPNEDIQNLSFTNQSFDYILCNHVIEHVPDDHSAFKEISRILKLNGKAIITIPGDYHLKNTVEFKKTDSNGHFRHYGLDVIEKMRVHFKNVETVDMNSLSKKNYGIRKNDLAFICGN